MPDLIPFHPLAERFFPLMGTDDLTALAEDIRAHGQQDPLVLFQGQILDGRNRAMACQQLGRTPRTTTFHGTEAEAVEFVFSENRHRRHLTPAQKAFAEGERRQFYKEAAAHRLREGQQRAGRPRENTPLNSEDNFQPSEKKEDTDTVAPSTPLPHAGEWATEAGKAAGVSRDTMYKVQTILDSGNTEVIAQAKAGEISIHKAVQHLKQPPPPAGASPVPTKPRAKSPVPIDLHPPGEALRYLQYWWAKASQPERDQFVTWMKESPHGSDTALAYPTRV